MTSLTRTAAASSLGGVALLVAHQMVLGSMPPADASAATATQYLQTHGTAMLTSAWLDGFGSVLLVLAVFALVRMTGSGFWHDVAVRVAGVIIALSLVIDAVLIAAVGAAASGATAAAGTLWTFAFAIDAAFPIANTVWMVVLGVLLVRSRALPVLLGRLLVAVGALEFLGGTTALYSDAARAVNNWVFLALIVWMLATGVLLAVRSRRTPDPAFSPA
jgi:hypothetical protein